MKVKDTEGNEKKMTIADALENWRRPSLIPSEGHPDIKKYILLYIFNFINRNYSKFTETSPDSLRIYDVWQFSECDDDFGVNYKEKQERDNQILDLWLSCWSTREIAEKYGLGKSTVDEIIRYMSTYDLGLPEKEMTPKALVSYSVNQDKI